MALLAKLWLNENRIGDAGMAALSKALAAGRLPSLSLESLKLEGNPASAAAAQAASPIQGM